VFPAATGRADSPNEKLNIGVIGCNGRANANIGGVLDQNIVALCDVDSNNLAKQKARFTDARTYADFRQLFDKEEKAIDAVVISTPDHTHFLPTAHALVRGKHVYCEKPLTHTVEEARLAKSMAEESGCITQMGTQIHATDNYRRVVEIVRSGMLGDIESVYCWCGKGWSNGRYQIGETAPDHLNWPLWLGPAQKRPYLSNVHPANWRRFWDFGNGTLGDMACHIMDLPFWALSLTAPDRISASGEPPHPAGTPTSVSVHYRFPKTDAHGPLDLHWSDGGKMHERVLAVSKEGGPDLSKWGIGALFVGTKGILAADYGRRVLLPADKFGGAAMPDRTIAPSVGHHREWVEGCKTGTQTSCHFGYSAPLTQTVLLGTVAYRAGVEIEWDDAKGLEGQPETVTAFLRKEYPSGWEIPNFG